MPELDCIDIGLEPDSKQHTARLSTTQKKWQQRKAEFDKMLTNIGSPKSNEDQNITRESQVR